MGKSSAKLRETCLCVYRDVKSLDIFGSCVTWTGMRHQRLAGTDLNPSLLHESTPAFDPTCMAIDAE